MSRAILIHFSICGMHHLPSKNYVWHRECCDFSRRSKRHIACSDFYKSQSALILLLLLSKSQPLTLDFDLVRYGAAERPQNGFLFQKEGHDIRRVPLFPSMCQHHMFRFCLVIRIILLSAGIAPDRSPTIGRRPVPGKFPLTKPDSR